MPFDHLIYDVRRAVLDKCSPIRERNVRVLIMNVNHGIHFCFLAHRVLFRGAIN